jgi:hypothetical protein
MGCNITVEGSRARWSIRLGPLREPDGYVGASGSAKGAVMIALRKAESWVVKTGCERDRDDRVVQMAQPQTQASYN